MNASGRGGEVQFILQRVIGGLYVEREETPRRGLHTVQAILFDGNDDFRRWCDGDPSRFEHPLLHTGLKRIGDDLLRVGVAGGIS